MDPLGDADGLETPNGERIKKGIKNRKGRNDEASYSSEEEEENLSFMQKLGGFLFFGCGGGSKR